MVRLLSLALLAAGCAPVPEIDGARSDGAATTPPPRIVPLEPLLATVPEDRASLAGEEVEARADALRARGGALGKTGPGAAAAEDLAARRARLAEARNRLEE